MQWLEHERNVADPETPDSFKRQFWDSTLRKARTMRHGKKSPPVTPTMLRGSSYDPSGAIIFRKLTTSERQWLYKRMKEGENAERALEAANQATNDLTKSVLEFQQVAETYQTRDSAVVSLQESIRQLLAENRALRKVLGFREN